MTQIVVGLLCLLAILAMFALIDEITEDDE